MLSRASQYGIKATICIANNADLGKRIRLGYIAESIDSPEAYTAKILQKLVHGGIINSFKGVSGGFELAKEDVTVWDIVSVIEGNDLLTTCVLGLKRCSSAKPCPVHDQYKEVKQQLINFLSSTKAKELAQKVRDGEVTLHIYN